MLSVHLTWRAGFGPGFSAPSSQKYLIFSTIANVALSRCCDGASKEAAASQAFVDKEHPTQVLLLMSPN